MRSKATKTAVRFNFLEEGFSLRDRGRLKSFVVSIFKEHRKPLLSINYIFCSDKYLLKINQTYLKHDYYTDIISFDLSSNNLTEGEIYISIDRIRENAVGLKRSFREELHRVIFHGALHLCGLADLTIEEKMKMRLLEDKCLSRYFRKVPRKTVS
jgi:rRNA maturation RNase YbeY